MHILQGNQATNLTRVAGVLITMQASYLTELGPGSVVQLSRGNLAPVISVSPAATHEPSWQGITAP